MTDRLYYADPYLREFDAIVERVTQAGERHLVTLDRTAFYPTSGGQPFDTGVLASLRIVDVLDSDDGSVTHVIEPGGAALKPGDQVHGAIDWERRFEHMQQHTGQHVLSAAFHQAVRADTVSFHLGAASATIDLSREVTPREIAAAEELANRVVWEDRPVTISFATAAEAARLPLRKEPARGGTLRLIEVKDFDLSACGGTHVSRTGAIGVIAVSSWERFKGGLRIEFVCGVRALRRFGVMRDVTASAGRLLSVGVEELPAAIERVQVEAKDQKRALSGLQSELLVYRAAELIASAEDTPAGRLVCRSVDADAQALKALALAVVATPGHVAVFVSASRPALAVVARSQDVTMKANDVLASLIARFGGRGGGKPDMAQGGGLDAAPEEIVAVAREIVGH